jgi:hypothetical protein
MAYAENPSLGVEFRVLEPGSPATIVSYGFKKPAVDEIKKLALAYRKAVASKGETASVLDARDLLDGSLAQECFSDYLQHACPDDLCRTHPEYFIWPSEKFFVHYRPQ